MIARAEDPLPETAAFRGDLRAIPFARIVEFCEEQALTGEVVVEADAFRAVVPFRGGEVADHAEGEAIARAFELSDGAFEIRVRPVDFGALRAAAKTNPPDPAWRPPGRLSAVMVGDRLVQLQTEYVTTPTPRVVSVGLREGKAILKRSARAAGAREAIARLVESQHAEVEREVRQKLSELAAARAGETPVPTPATASSRGPDFGTLFEQGLNHFLAGDLRGALAAWEAASALDPSHATLQVNLAVVRRKLGRG